MFGIYQSTMLVKIRAGGLVGWWVDGRLRKMENKAKRSMLELAIVSIILIQLLW